MPSQKFKNKQRLNQKRPEQSCSCHMKYDFNARCFTAANAARIAAAFPEISFSVDTSQKDGVGLHLDGRKFFYRYAEPEFAPLFVGENEDCSNETLHAVWHDVEKIAKNLVDLLFAATHHDPDWLETPEAQQVGGAFSASQFIRDRFHARLEEIGSTVQPNRMDALPMAETLH